METLLNNASIYKDLAIFECGKEECIGKKNIALTKKTYHLFHYVTSGRGTLILNNKEYKLTKGYSFFIPKDTDAIYFSDPDDPWSYEWIGIDGEKIDEFLECLGTSIENPVFNDPMKIIRNHLDVIVNRYITYGSIDLIALGELYFLFGELLEKRSERTAMVAPRVTIELAKAYIRNNYQFDIKISDIAKNANVTANYLSVIFQKEEGMSTKTYLTKIRMEKALALLGTGRFKVKEVGELVGYKNQLHFSSEFKKYYGVSPNKYLSKEQGE